MRQQASVAAARRVAADLGIDDDRIQDDLTSDELFAATAYLYEQADLYAGQDDAVEANQEAVAALRDAVLEHGERLLGKDPRAWEGDA